MDVIIEFFLFIEERYEKINYRLIFILQYSPLSYGI